MQKGKKKYPKCFGHYSRSDRQCNGDRKGPSSIDKLCCAMRDRCVALRKHCEINNLKISNYMRRERIVDEDGERRTYCFTHLEDKDLGDMLNRTIKGWAIVNGRVTRTEVEGGKTEIKKKKSIGSTRRATPMDESTKRKIAKANKNASDEAIDRAREFCMRFAIRLSRISKRKLSQPKQASPGDLVLVDRMKNSRYVSIYLEMDNGNRVAIAVVCPSIRTKRAEIRIAVPIRYFRRNEISKLFLIDFSDGKFVTKTGKLDIGDMALVAEIICRFISEGIIGTPSEVASVRGDA